MSDENDQVLGEEQQDSKGLEFVIERQTIPVCIRDKGRIYQYTLVELDGHGRDKYMNNLAQRMRVDATGKPSGVKDFTGLHAYLIHLSLQDEMGHNVLEKVIQCWPSSVQKAIHKKAIELSGLDEESTQKTKNS